MKNIAVIAPSSKNWDSFENTAECDRLYEKTKEFLKNASEKEGVCLISSLNIGYETLAAMTVLNLKEKHDLMLECVIPYEERASDWTEADRDRYFTVIEKCDKETIIERRYTPEAEYNAVCYMADRADEIITFGQLPLKAGTVVSRSGKNVIKL